MSPVSKNIVVISKRDTVTFRNNHNIPQDLKVVLILAQIDVQKSQHMPARLLRVFHNIEPKTHLNQPSAVIHAHCFALNFMSIVGGQNMLEATGDMMACLLKLWAFLRSLRLTKPYDLADRFW